MPAAKINHLPSTQRDIEIILAIYFYDGMVSKQIKRRFWGNFKGHRHCLRRIQQLIQTGFLRSQPLPPANGSSGSGFHWLTLGPSSYYLLKEHLALTTADIKRLPRMAPLYFQHELLVRDIRVSIELACQLIPGVTLSEWVTDRALKANPIKVKAQDPSHPDKLIRLELVPDGIFTLERTSHLNPKHFYLECDRGTMVSPARFKARLAAFLLHLKAAPSPVLLVVPDEKRRGQLARWAREEAQRLNLDPGIFGIALAQHITEQTILTAPIWMSVDGSRFFNLIPLAPTIVAAPPAGLTPEEWLQQLYGSSGGGS